LRQDGNAGLSMVLKYVVDRLKQSARYHWKHHWSHWIRRRPVRPEHVRCRRL